MHVSRLVFAILAWLFVGLVVLQVFYAGVGLLGGGTMADHREFGYLVAMFPLLVLIAAAVSRLGRLAWWTAGLLVLAQVQTILPWFAEDAPFVAALHPVVALVIFWGGLTIARRATAMARERVEATAEASQPQPTAT